jgi:hypothetical protein
MRLTAGDYPVVARWDLPGLTYMRTCYSSMQTFDEKAMLAGQEIGT